jgi:hypothetical protein
MDALRGNCAGSVYPDAWFPEMRAGTPSKRTVNRLSYTVKYALSKCADCPIKKECLDEGMKPENIAYGIWGGFLAGERLAMVGHTPEEFFDGGAEMIAFNILKRVELY